MKQIILVIILLYMSNICHGMQVIGTDTRIATLKEAYNKKDYPTFYKVFPNSYKELLSIYGFDDKTGEKPLYTLADKHIDYFFEFADHIALDEFIRRCYKIAENGIWEADAVAYFQINLTNLVIEHPKDVVEMLNTLSKKEEKEFWFFLFDGPVAGYNILKNPKFISFINRLDSLNAEQTAVLKKRIQSMH